VVSKAANDDAADCRGGGVGTGHNGDNRKREPNSHNPRRIRVTIAAGVPLGIEARCRDESAEDGQHEKEVADGIYCLKIRFGVADTLIGISLEAPTTYCIPNEIENDRLIRIVVRSLKDHPDTLQYPDAVLVTKAIRRCAKTSKSGP
jgi:hypothetical protein